MNLKELVRVLVNGVVFVAGLAIPVILLLFIVNLVTYTYTGHRLVKHYMERRSQEK